MDRMTYIEPIVNMNSRPNFCFNGSCKPKTMGMGRMKRIRSEAILQTAVAIYSAVELMHVPSVMDTSKLFWTGLHANIKLKKMPIE